MATTTTTTTTKRPSASACCASVRKRRSRTTTTKGSAATDDGGGGSGGNNVKTHPLLLLLLLVVATLALSSSSSSTTTKTSSVWWCCDALVPPSRRHHIVVGQARSPQHISISAIPVMTTSVILSAAVNSDTASSSTTTIITTANGRQELHESNGDGGDVGVRTRSSSTSSSIRSGHASSSPSTVSVPYDPADIFYYYILDDDEIKQQQQQQQKQVLQDPAVRPIQNGQARVSSLDLQDLSDDNSSDAAGVHDIVRDLDDKPLSTEYLTSKMGISPNLMKVEGYVCPEEHAFRGFMSNGCRIQLLPSGDTAFYKRIVFQTLGHAQEKFKTSPFKLVRDMKSYEVVASLLQSKACQMLRDDTGIMIPQLYDADLRPCPVEPIKSKFSFLLEDYSPTNGWYQQWLLYDKPEMEATLTTYAKLHAYFWTGSKFWRDYPVEAQEFEDSVWSSGSYVQPQAQDPNQCYIVAKEWSTKKLRFETDLQHFDFYDNLGERLESVAVQCGRHAHPFADNEELGVTQYRKYRTFTHGDPKQANLLFRRQGNDEDIQVGLIDFQWSGFGLAASDVAHLLTSAVHADLLVVNDGEQKLMKYYFTALQHYLVEYGAYASTDEALEQYNYDTFVEQYETAVLDIVRLVIAYTWSRFEVPVSMDDSDELKTKTLNKTSYNKSIPNIVWLMSRCDEILTKRGV